MLLKILGHTIIDFLCILTARNKNSTVHQLNVTSGTDQDIFTLQNFVGDPFCHLSHVTNDRLNVATKG